MYILAIETSCDETACAIVENGTKEIVSVIASSKELHEATGGIVPEIAARKQMEFMVPVLEQTLDKFSKYFANANYSRDDLISKIDAIAVTVGPGLIGSLLIGIEAAKSLALAWDKPLIPVNHLVGHIYANFIERDFEKNITFPAVALVVSGGHTDLVLIKSHGNFEYLGGTMDDAAGEAYDKTARLLGLAKYLGGAELSKLAATCDNNVAAGVLPRPLLKDPNYDFSFSGLKTAVKRLVESNKYSANVVACEFETSVVDVLVTKTVKAALSSGAKQILLGGGVSANKNLRTRLTTEAKIKGVTTFVPEFDLCTDNAVYIAAAAYFTGQSYLNNKVDFTKVIPNPSLGVMDKLAV